MESTYGVFLLSKNVARSQFVTFVKLHFTQFKIKFDTKEINKKHDTDMRRQAAVLCIGSLVSIVSIVYSPYSRSKS